MAHAPDARRTMDMVSARWQAGRVDIQRGRREEFQAGIRPRVRAGQGSGREGFSEVKTYTIPLRRYVDQIGGKSATVDEPTLLYEICRTTEADFRQFVPGPVTEPLEFWRRVLDAIETAHSIRCQESMSGGKHLGKRERLEMILQSRLVDTITRGLRGPGTVVDESKPAKVDPVTQKSLF